MEQDLQDHVGMTRYVTSARNLFHTIQADHDVRMRLAKDGTCYEYFALYADDMAIATKDPKEICDILQEKIKLKLKGPGPLSYHLGYSYVRDPEGTLVGDPSRDVARIIEAYEKMLEASPERLNLHWKEETMLNWTHQSFAMMSRSSRTRLSLAS